MITCSEEEKFHEALLTLLNGTQHLQRQSLNMMQDMNHRCEYDNLICKIYPFMVVKHGLSTLVIKNREKWHCLQVA